MKVQCILCERIDELDDRTFLAKKLRNRPYHTYLCEECHERITRRTLERHATGKFRLYRSRDKDDDWYL